MIKLHCDLCDEVITDDRPRVRFKKYPHQMENKGFNPAAASVDVTICENCLSHFTLADIVARFERKKL